MSGLTSRRNPSTRVDVNKSIFVDDKYGDDLTGLTERPDRPFKTIEAALAIATALDTVFVQNGTYTPVGSLTFPDQVNLFAEDQVTINMDNGFIDITGTNSILGESIINSAFNGPAVVVGATGVLDLRFKELSSTVKQGILKQDGGAMIVRGTRIFADGSAITMNGDGEVNVFITEEIDSDFAQTIVLANTVGFTPQKINISAKRIINRDNPADANLRGACFYMTNTCVNPLTTVVINADLKSDLSVPNNGEYAMITHHGNGQIIHSGDAYGQEVAAVAHSYSQLYRSTQLQPGGVYMNEGDSALILHGGVGGGNPSQDIITMDECVLIKNGNAKLANDPVTIINDETGMPNGQAIGGRSIYLNQCRVLTSGSFTDPTELFRSGANATQENVVFNSQITQNGLAPVGLCFNVGGATNTWYVENTVSRQAPAVGFVNAAIGVGLTVDPALPIIQGNRHSISS